MEREYINKLIKSNNTKYDETKNIIEEIKEKIILNLNEDKCKIGNKIINERIHKINSLLPKEIYNKENPNIDEDKEFITEVLRNLENGNIKDAILELNFLNQINEVIHKDEKLLIKKNDLDRLEKLVMLKELNIFYENNLIDSEWKEFKGDVIITDPCYLRYNNDCDENLFLRSNLEHINSHGLIHSTIYGDWSCTTFNIDNNKILGQFCADSGEVGVFLLEDVLNYNPHFNYHVEKPWTTTLIEKFNGKIKIKIDKKDDDYIVYVIGKGNINFITKQTGF